eukprot:s7018_g1.t1
MVKLWPLPWVAAGLQVPRTHQSRSWRGTSLIGNVSRLFDPGVKKRERLSEEVILAQRIYEHQDTAAHDLVASRLHAHFTSLSGLCGAWDVLETSFEECLLAHISEITLHYEPLFEAEGSLPSMRSQKVKISVTAEDLHEDGCVSPVLC